MNYQEKILLITTKIKSKEFTSAEQDLLKIIEYEEIKNVEDKENVYYNFTNYPESLVAILYGIRNKQKNDCN